MISAFLRGLVVASALLLCGVAGSAARGGSFFPPPSTWPPNAAPPSRGATLVEEREAVERAERLARAIMTYGAVRGAWPADLAQLVPDFASASLARNPFGGVYTYRPTKWSFTLETRLPGGGVVTMTNGEVTSAPLRLLTQGEAARWNRRILRRLAMGLEAYRVDSNEYPASLAELVPFYIAALPLRDAYGGDIVVSLRRDAYSLTSLGRDGRPGGVGVDADVTIATGVVTTTAPAEVSEREYALASAGALSAVANAVCSYAVDNNHAPASLDLLVPVYVAAVPLDGCGRPLAYRLAADGRSFVVGAAGFPCDVAFPGRPLDVRVAVGGAECSSVVIGQADVWDVLD